MRGALANGEQIRDARVSRGLTQEQLAALADVDVKTVRKAEQGKRLDVGTLAHLAHTLQIEMQRAVLGSHEESDLQSARRRAIERWIMAWDARDSEAIMSVYHERAVMHLPGAPGIPFGGNFAGKEEIRRGNELAWSTARTVPQGPDCYAFLAHDDTVMFHGEKGIYLPNGDVARLWCVQIFTFEGDLIIDHRVEYDTIALQKLLGLPAAEESTG